MPALKKGGLYFMAYKIVIIGANAAGMSAAMEAKRENSDYGITVFEKSSYASYGACPMPYYISGRIDDHRKLFAREVSYFEEKGIEMKIKTEVIEINTRDKKVVYIEKGQQKEMSYDKLLIATGSKARHLPFEKEAQNSFNLVKLEDALAIKEYLKDNQIKKAVVIGGGYIGVEVADSFRELGIQTSVVEMFQMLAAFDNDIVDPIRERAKDFGNVDIYENTGVKDIVYSEGKAQKVILDNGKELPTDILIISAGVVPDTKLAQDAGIKIAKNGAIIVNKRMQTSNHNIFAAGDCALIYNMLLDDFVYLPLGTNANRAGKAVGKNFEHPKSEVRIMGNSMLELFGLEMGNVGISEKMAKNKNMNVVVETAKIRIKPGYFSKDSILMKFVADKYSGTLLGVQMVGDSSVHDKINQVAGLIYNRMKVQDIEDIDMGYHPVLSTLWDPIILMARKITKKLEVR